MRPAGLLARDGNLGTEPRIEREVQRLERGR